MAFFVYSMHIPCYTKMLLLPISDHNLEQSRMKWFNASGHLLVLYEKVDKQAAEPLLYDINLYHTPQESIYYTQFP